MVGAAHTYRNNRVDGMHCTMTFEPPPPGCASIRRSGADMATGSDMNELQDAVARAVTTALRARGYAVDSEDEADSPRLKLIYMYEY